MKQTVLPGFETSDASSAPYDNPRIIYYLGSKYRILPQVINKISNIAKEKARICDLFSGSGSVAVALSEHWNVITVDIQEYSSVLGNALLNFPVIKDPLSWHLIRQRAEESDFRINLIKSLAEILKIESDAIELAKRGYPNKLADLTRMNPPI